MIWGRNDLFNSNVVERPLKRACSISNLYKHLLYVPMNVRVFIKSNWITIFSDFVLVTSNKDCRKTFALKTMINTKVFEAKQWQTIASHFRGACFLSKHLALLMMWWRHLMRPGDLYYKRSFFKLIYHPIWTFLD